MKNMLPNGQKCSKQAKEIFRRMRLVIKNISTRLGCRSMRRYLPNKNEALPGSIPPGHLNTKEKMGNSFTKTHQKTEVDQILPNSFYFISFQIESYCATWGGLEFSKV